MTTAEKARLEELQIVFLNNLRELTSSEWDEVEALEKLELPKIRKCVKSYYHIGMIAYYFTTERFNGEVWITESLSDYYPTEKKATIAMNL